jgi:hypothetical protein
MIPEAVTMETAIIEATATEPVAKSSAAIAPKPRAEARVDPQPEASTEVVVCEVVIEDAVPLRSAPMPETGTSSHGDLELLDDDLIDPAFVSLSMDLWHHIENWIKVCCEYPRLSCHIEYWLLIDRWIMSKAWWRGPARRPTF